MSVTTKTGDSGQTSLFSGERVWKDDLRVDAYGALDELDALLGEARHAVTDPDTQAILEGIQNTLYRVMGQLASKNAAYPYPLTQKDVEEITALAAELEEKTPLTGFVLPGSLPASAKLDVCRAVARRAERQAVKLSRAEAVPPEILQYLNRLSDLLFMLARSVEAAAGALRYVKKPIN